MFKTSYYLFSESIMDLRNPSETKKIKLIIKRDCRIILDRIDLNEYYNGLKNVDKNGASSSTKKRKITSRAPPKKRKRIGNKKAKSTATTKSPSSSTKRGEINVYGLRQRVGATTFKNSLSAPTKKQPEENVKAQTKVVHYVPTVENDIKQSDDLDIIEIVDVEEFEKTGLKAHRKNVSKSTREEFEDLKKKHAKLQSDYDSLLNRVSILEKGCGESSVQDANDFLDVSMGAFKDFIGDLSVQDIYNALSSSDVANLMEIVHTTNIE